MGSGLSNWVSSFRTGVFWWRRCMGIEPTARVRRATGFEDQGSHQTPFTSFYIFLAVPQLAQIFYAGGYARRIEMFHQRNYVFSR